MGGDGGSNRTGFIYKLLPTLPWCSFGKWLRSTIWTRIVSPFAFPWFCCILVRNTWSCNCPNRGSFCCTDVLPCRENPRLDPSRKNSVIFDNRKARRTNRWDASFCFSSAFSSLVSDAFSFFSLCPEVEIHFPCSIDRPKWPSEIFPWEFRRRL